MARKKKEIIVDQEADFIASLKDEAMRDGLEDLSLKFSAEEINLPEPIVIRNPGLSDVDGALQAAASKPKSKPRYVPGNRFYLYLGQKRVKGKWKGAVEHVRVTEEEKTVDVLTKVWNSERGEVVKKYVPTDVRVRKESRQSKAFIERERQRKIREAA